jgi:uncharacterized protein with HEPN domain
VWEAFFAKDAVMRNLEIIGEAGRLTMGCSWK